MNVPRLIAAYYAVRPDPAEPSQRVSFGTSGHRGTSERGSFNDAHIAAIAQAIAEHRRAHGVTGPLFLGMDTHALSEPARITALEVLAANDVDVVLEAELGYTPTPVISHAILTYNRAHPDARADGIVITPSHNPPADGGFKYNPPTGGPADTATTAAIEKRANEILASDTGIRRTPYARALAAGRTTQSDLAAAYVADLTDVIDIDAIRASGLRIGADPMGGASVAVWQRIADHHRLPIEVVNDRVDPTFAFMPPDRDGKIRMDCSSPHAMAGLIGLRERFDIAFGNDPDADRHGIVVPSRGLMNPNHYLAVAVDYLFQERTAWPVGAGVGKTLVSSAMMDRIAASLGRQLVEVPVGFKWFVDGLLTGTLAFGGEESAGASFLRRNGAPWSTDKDGILLNLLAAEITARAGRDPGDLYAELEARHGSPRYERFDAPANAAQKRVLANLSPEQVTARELAGEPILARLTRAPGNDAPIGGLKVVTENGWFAARPSGTEDIYKIYAESFLGEEHVRRIQTEAREIVDGALAAASVPQEASRSE